MYFTAFRKASCLTIAIVIFLMLTPWLRYSQTPSETQSSQTLIRMEVSPPRVGGRGSGVSRSREVKLNQEAINSLIEAVSVNRDLTFLSTSPSARLQFNLFDSVGEKVVYRGVVEEVSKESSDKIAFIGKLYPMNTETAQPSGNFTMVSRNNAIAISVTSPEGRFYLLPTKDGNHVVQQLSSKTQFVCKVKVSKGKRARIRRGIAASRLRALRDDGRQVDVLVVYTKKAKDKVGGDANVKARVDLWERETNEVFRNSEIDLSIRVVGGIRETAFTETSGNKSSDKDLDRLSGITGITDVNAAQVRQWRDDVHADQVMLIREGSDTDGIAYLLEPPGFDYDYDQKRAYASIEVDPDYAYVFTHELGHNYGCQHDSGIGWKSYSNGYCFTGNDGVQYGTVMSYCGADNRIPFFSNPNKIYKGKPIGKAGDDGYDNARTIRETKEHLANYRLINP